MGIRVSASARVGLSFATSALFVAASAAAEEAPRLEYVVHEGTPGCPSDAEFRDAVAARLGRDAFAGESRRRLVVDVRVEEGELSATGALVEADGSSAGIRRMTGGDCREVVEGMALAVSLAISGAFAMDAEPEGAPPLAPPDASEPKPVAPSPPPPTTPAVQEVDRGVATSEAAEREDRAAFGGGLSLHAALGVGPGVGAGGSLFMTGRRAPWSLSVEGRFDGLSTGMSFETGGSASTTLLAGVIAPCRHFGAVAACALGLVGRISGESKDVSSPGSDEAPYAAAGGRLAVEMLWSRSVLVQGRLDLLATLLPVDIELGGERMWDSPPVSALVGAGIVVLP